MKKMMITLFLCLSLATMVKAQSAPTAVQDPNGSLVVESASEGGANIYKYNGAPTKFDAPLDIHGVSVTAKKMPNGTYTMAFYADPEGGAIYCGEQDGGIMTEDMNKMKRYAPSKGYRYEYYLGNLFGAQRKKMPPGSIDQANKRVIFEGVVLKPGHDIRVNLVVKIFGPDGKEIKAQDPNGFYGWTTDDPDKSVVGIKDNGWLFEVLPDGTIQGKGEDHRPNS